MGTYNRKECMRSTTPAEQELFLKSQGVTGRAWNR